jgi:hypothetical protein
MTNTNPKRSRKFRTVFVSALAALALAGAFISVPAKDYGDDVASVTFEIRHRMHPNFHQVVTTKMNRREQIGDTDMFFEAVEFYPHFAIVDSTKKVMSTSDEPTNAAFKIRVYDGEEVVENTWAFFTIKIPHYARTSFLKFDVVSFEYRGETFGEKQEENNQ